MTAWRLCVIWLCLLLTVLSAALKDDYDVPPSRNHGPVVMGVSNDHCDNAKVSLLDLLHLAFVFVLSS